MSRRIVLLLAFTPLLLLLVGVGAYYMWGGALKRRYVQRLAELRAAGEPIEWADLFEPPVPQEDNGAAKLQEAHAILDAFEDGIQDEDGLGPQEAMFVPHWDEDLPWIEEERAAVIEALERLAPYFAKLEEARAYPRLELASDGPLGESLSHPVDRAIRHWDLRARIDPTQRAASLDRIFGLLLQWKDRGDTILFSVVEWGFALELLREAMVDGTLPDEALLDRWGPTFEAEAAIFPAQVRHTRRMEPVYVAWAVSAWAAGRDPFEPLNAGISSLRDVPGMTKVAAENQEIGDFLDQLDRLAESWSQEWLTRWWGRPLLWKAATLNLDGYDALRRVDLSSPESIRTWLLEVRDEPRVGTHDHRSMTAQLLIHKAAELELARLALAVHDFALASGEAPEHLLDLAPLFGGVLPVDPLTGGPFLYETHDGEVILQTDPNGPLLRHVLRIANESEADLLEEMDDHRLQWRLPLP